MPSDGVLIYPDDNQAEPPFALYFRSTLSAALRLRNQSYLSLASHGGHDIMSLPTEVSEAYQWHLIYSRPTKQALDGKKNYEYGLLCIGEAIGDDLREAMISAGLGTRFTVIGGSEFRKLDGLNRRGWIFDPSTTPIDCQLNIAWSATTPDWQNFGDTITGMRVQAAFRL